MIIIVHRRLLCSALHWLAACLPGWPAGGCSVDSRAGMRAKSEFALTIFGFVSAKASGGS